MDGIGKRKECEKMIKKNKKTRGRRKEESGR